MSKISKYGLTFLLVVGLPGTIYYFLVLNQLQDERQSEQFLRAEKVSNRILNMPYDQDLVPHLQREMYSVGDVEQKLVIKNLINNLSSQKPNPRNVCLALVHFPIGEEDNQSLEQLIRVETPTEVFKCVLKIFRCRGDEEASFLTNFLNSLSQEDERVDAVLSSLSESESNVGTSILDSLLKVSRLQEHQWRALVIAGNQIAVNKNPESIEKLKQIVLKAPPDLIDGLNGLVKEASKKDVPPPKEYIAKNPCPFECCQYGEWVARKDIVIVSEPKGKAIGKVVEGEKVKAVEGLGYLTPKRYVLEKAQGNVPAGATIWLLEYIGEGHSSIWYNGSVIEGFEVDESTSMDWWMKLRKQNGLEGWTNQIDFDGTDGCG